MVGGECMKVTVYCTVYNHEKYIKSALDGFVMQKTNFDYEVVVHDDASTDASAEIIKQYAKKYPNIIKPILQYRNQCSQGIDILHTYIAPQIKGEYVAICEGDDYWCDCNKLQEQVDFLDNNTEYIACVHNSKILNLFKNKSYDMYEHKGNRDIDFCDVVKGGGAAYHTSSLMYRKEFVYGRPHFFKTAKGYSDYPLAMYLATLGKIYFIDKIMSVYRFGTLGSYTCSGESDLRKNVSIPQNRIELLKEVNKYTDYKYDIAINRVIVENEYQIQEMLDSYQTLKKDKFYEIYKKKSFKYKCKIFFKQYFTNTYHILRKLKYKKFFKL